MTILPLLLCALAYPAPAALGGLYAHEAAALHVSELTYKEFDERNARVLARQISGAGTGRRTGKQMLEALLTERSILPRTMPDLTLERPATYGHVKAELHQLAAESRLPRFAEFLDQAFDHGLLYRFNDPYGTEYVGVTEAARQALGLDWPVPPDEIDRKNRSLPALQEFRLRRDPKPAVPEPPPARSPLQRGFLDLAAQAAQLSSGDPLLETVYQAIDAAVRDSVLDREALPEEFRAATAGLESDGGHLEGNLLNLLEAAHGTPLFGSALRLCARACRLGLGDRSNLQDVLETLSPPLNTASPKAGPGTGAG